METQKIVTVLNGSDNENAKCAIKKWYVIDSESKDQFLTKSIESSFCDYSDTYILVTEILLLKGEILLILLI